MNSSEGSLDGFAFRQVPKGSSSPHEAKGWEALMALSDAALRGELAEVERLLEANANVNEKNINGESPLHCAAYNGHHEVVDRLIQANANLNEKAKV
ncbi:MAG: hypothetical protein SGPRY_005758 [Prymnesium sp.]